MKYKKEIIITLIITMLILFLKKINILQIENNLGKPLSLVIIIIVSAISSITIQKKIDNNYEKNNINYKNLDILKYIFAILIIILHLRPFLNISNELDLAFNNIITRICVPMFFVITGYFTSQKEKNNLNYIKDYIKKTIPTYLRWSIIYLPIVIAFIITNFSLINDYLTSINISIYLLVILAIIFLPLIIIIALIYTGIYYHLWYFPAVILSLLLLFIWKKKFNIKFLLVLSFFLLLFGATETYYGILPLTIKELVSYYYNIFFTTRNFLFFGLFYVVLGYYIGKKDKPYSKYCFELLIVSIFALVFEAIILHGTERLNSNILLSCIPLTYYLFISAIYLTKEKKKKTKFKFRDYSKYYYLIHPAIIFIVQLILNKTSCYLNPYIQIVIVLLLTHAISNLIIRLKLKYNKLIL